MKGISTDEEVLVALAADGLLERDEDRFRTTRRWQGAMARAATKLATYEDPPTDLRVPITIALVEIYGSSVDSETLADYVEAMLLVQGEALGLIPSDA